MASVNTIDITVDVVIPCVIVLMFFIIAGVVLAFIMHKRRQIVYEDVLVINEDECGNVESSTSARAAFAAATSRPAAETSPVRNICTIEMEPLRH